MKRARLTLVVAVAVGLFAAIPAIAQTTGVANADELGIAITINKLELTPVQMQQVHDILAGILSEGNALKEKNDEFTQEMIRFTGSSTDLETALSNFKAQIKDQAQTFQENVQQALDQLKGILTIEQGEILRNASMHARNQGLAAYMPADRGQFSAATRLGDRRTMMPNQDSMGRQPQEQEDNADDARAALPERMQQMMDNHPELAERMAQCVGNMSEQQAQAGAWRPSSHLQAPADGNTFLAQRGGGELLDLLQKVVNILEAKLQYVQQ